MTVEERREAVVDALAQAVLDVVLARLEQGARAAERPQVLRSKELAMSAEQRLHVYESAGEDRWCEEPNLVEVRP
jgi:hypothetical protein